MTEKIVEQLFWAVTWKHTVEKVSARLFEDKWIINRNGGPVNTVYSKIGVDLFDTEAEALIALAERLEREKVRLDEWIASVRDRAAILIDGG